MADSICPLSWFERVITDNRRVWRTQSAPCRGLSALLPTIGVFGGLLAAPCRGLSALLATIGVFGGLLAAPCRYQDVALLLHWRLAVERLPPCIFCARKNIGGWLIELSTSIYTMLSVENVFACAKNYFGWSAVFFAAAGPCAVAIDSGNIF